MASTMHSRHRSTKYRRSVCRYFLKGQCGRGNSCKYIHPTTDNDNLPPTQPNSSTSEPPAPGLSTPTVTIQTKTKMCKYFGHGFCKRGFNCKSIHETFLYRIRDVRGSNYLPEIHTHCFGYVSGYCPLLSACPYLHPLFVQPFFKYTPCPQGFSCVRWACPLMHNIAVASRPQRPAPGDGAFINEAVVRFGAFEMNGMVYFPPGFPYSA